MRVLTHVYDHDELDRLVSLMHEKGIPTYARDVISRGNEHWVLFVCINSQAADARRILHDPDHEPAQSVNVGTFERAAYSRGWDVMIKWGLGTLVIAAATFGLIMYLAVRQGQ